MTRSLPPKPQMFFQPSVSVPRNSLNGVGTSFGINFLGTAPFARQRLGQCGLHLQRISKSVDFRADWFCLIYHFPRSACTMVRIDGQFKSLPTIRTFKNMDDDIIRPFLIFEQYIR
jgi:hypothetical protein